MKNIIILLLIVAGISSCQNTSNDLDSVKQQINDHRMEIVNLENEIRKLEKILADSNVSISEGSILVGIQKIKSEKFVHYLDITGNVETHLQAYISPEINGLIKKIDVSEGEYVTKGQVLAVIDTEIIRNSIDEVKTQLELAKTMYQKQKELWDQNIGSEIQYLQAKNRKESLESKLKTLNSQMEKATITAPFDAYIENVFQKSGEFGSPGRQIFFLVNLKDLKVTADISEKYIPYLHIGDSVDISFPTFPNIKLREPISVIGAVINPNNRTIKVQIQIHNEDYTLKPNIIASLSLSDESVDSAIVIPAIVVKNDANGNNYVYVVDNSNGKLISKKRYIKVGNSYGNKTMVTDGLSIEDKLIVDGYNLVKNGSKIHIK
jgi:RND family efflux transporter MFP subunit